MITPGSRVYPAGLPQRLGVFTGVTNTHGEHLICLDRPVVAALHHDQHYLGLPSGHGWWANRVEEARGKDE